MKECPECKSTVNDELDICPNCGYPFVEEELTKQTESTDVEEPQEPQEQPESTDVEEPQQTDIVNVGTAYNQVESAMPTSGRTRGRINKQLLIGIIIGGALVIALAVSVTKYNTMSGKFSEASKKLAAAEKDKAALDDEISALNDEINDLKEKNTELKDQNNELANGAAKQLTDVKNAFEQSDWKKVLDLASKLHEKYNGSNEDKEAQGLVQTAQQNIDNAEAAKAAEEAKGYETGISYDQLARTPDEFKGKKVKFYGKVVQVIEGDSKTQIRLAINDNYDTILLAQFTKSIVSRRILEDDYITVYGVSSGTISYKSTMGGAITIPGVNVDKIDQ